VNPFTEYSLSF